MFFPPIEYLEWSKALAADVNNIGASGIRPPQASELGLATGGMPLDAGNDAGYGAADSKAAIAARYGVEPHQVYATAGTSLANFLAAAALLDGGGHAIVEEPVYTPFLRQIEALAERVDRVPRAAAARFQLDPDQIAALLRSDTRLIAVTDLHNPTGARLGDEVANALAERAARVGAHLLIDEVYRDFCFGEPPSTSAALAPNIVTTNSLTKVYGLGALRFGWIIGSPAVVVRASRIHDHLGVMQPSPVTFLATRALLQAEALRNRARRLLDSSWSVLRPWLSGRDDLETVLPPAGSIVFPRWRGGDATVLAHRLLIDKRTAVIPGAFFLAPWGFRLSAVAPPDRLRSGLAALGELLDAEAG